MFRNADCLIWPRHDPPPFCLIRLWLVLVVCVSSLSGGRLMNLEERRASGSSSLFSDADIFIPALFSHSSFLSDLRLSVWPASYLTLLSEIILHSCFPKARRLYAASKREASASDLLIDILLPLLFTVTHLCLCVSFHLYLAVFSWR